MFDSGVAGHDDKRGSGAESESGTAFDYADLARGAEMGFYMIRYMVSEYLCSHLVDGNIPVFLKNYLFTMTLVTRQANIYN
jgi:hypothetical protein